MGWLENILASLVAWAENAFDFKNNRKMAVINTILLVCCGTTLIFCFKKNSTINQNMREARVNPAKISNQAEINRNTRKQYASYEKVYQKHPKSKAGQNAQNQMAKIQAAQTTDFTVRSPGEFQLQKLSCLTNQNMSISDKNKILQQYCFYSAGETEWLFQNWICNIVGYNSSNFSTGFDINDSILYINANLTPQQKDYLNQMVNLLWDYSALKPRTNPLKIKYTNNLQAQKDLQRIGNNQ